MEVMRVVLARSAEERAVAGKSRVHYDPGALLTVHGAGGLRPGRPGLDRWPDVDAARLLRRDGHPRWLLRSLCRRELLED
jgi:hypothetical protein